MLFSFVKAHFEIMYLRVLFNAFSDELTLEDKFNMHLSCNKTPSQQHNLDHVIDVREEEETCVSSFSFYSLLANSQI